MKPTVYDFDKTLTYHDTLLGFYCHATPRTLFYHAKRLLYLGAIVATKLKLIDNDRFKVIGIILFLRGQSRETLQQKGVEYAGTLRTNNLYTSLMENHSEEVWIVSASFEEYLVPLFGRERLLATRIAYDRDGNAAGLEFNCYKEEKRKALIERGVEQIGLFYTDHYSDLPVAEMSDTICLVDGDSIKECHSVEHFKAACGKS